MTIVIPSLYYKYVILEILNCDVKWLKLKSYWQNQKHNFLDHNTKHLTIFSIIIMQVSAMTYGIIFVIILLIHKKDARYPETDMA